MKQFLLFGYDTYYPSGGMRDFKESYDTEEEANAAGRALLKAEWPCDHWQVVDTESGDWWGGSK